MGHAVRYLGLEEDFIVQFISTIVLFFPWRDFVDMDYRHKRDVHTSHTERSSSTQIRQVQNVAFADATAKANVRPWTKAMFKVWIAEAFYKDGVNGVTAVSLPLDRHTQLLYQRIRWIAHGGYQQLPSVPFLF